MIRAFSSLLLFKHLYNYYTLGMILIFILPIKVNIFSQFPLRNIINRELVIKAEILFSVPLWWPYKGQRLEFLNLLHNNQCTIFL